MPSVGASGAIFGTVAVSAFIFPLLCPNSNSSQVSWVDLFTHWKYHYKPTTKVSLSKSGDDRNENEFMQLVFMIIELIIGIGIGFIPYVDNFGVSCIMDLASL